MVPSSDRTVRLIDTRGKVVASAQFSAPPDPRLPGCGALPPPQVRVASGAAYFADGSGVVRRLQPNGTITKVATFPITSSQQFLSFAVSQDGKQLIAIVFSTPPLHSPPPQSLQDPWWAPGGHWTLDLEEAKPGGSTSIVLHKDYGAVSYPVPGPTFITGWDDFAPTATLNTEYCVQQGPESVEYDGSPLIHLGLDGTHLDQIGGSDCVALDELADGTVFCEPKGYSDSFSVRRRNGDVLWARQPGCCFYEPRLAPDGSGVSTGAPTNTVFLRDSAQPASFARENNQNTTMLGWASTTLLVVVDPNGHLALAVAADPQASVDLGLPVNPQIYLSRGPYLAGLIGTP